jgi:ornithine cyclodeaminase/alanine dehydrogenase
MAVRTNQVILLSRADVSALLDFESCIAAVERALALDARGEMPSAASLGFPVRGGGFHIKVAALPGSPGYFAAKCNGNFPANPRSNGLPTIQGAIVLADAEDGRLLAIMDSIEITLQRTGAATALATRLLARKDARVATIFGCGTQGRIQLRAVLAARPLERIYAFDRDANAAERFAAEMGDAYRLDVIATDDLSMAARASDICVTCTTSQKWFLGVEHVRPGTFVAAVGADNPEKQELEPSLLARSVVIADSIAQAAEIGELHHAIAAKVATHETARGTLGQALVGLCAGRANEDEITIFDSTGIASEDVAAAALVYEAALRCDRGGKFHIS